MIKIGLFELVETRDGTYHGVRDGLTIYHVWPYPGEEAFGASYAGSNRFIVKKKTLRQMAKFLADRSVCVFNY